MCEQEHSLGSQMNPGLPLHPFDIPLSLYSSVLSVAFFSLSLSKADTRCSTVPVAVDEGIEGQSIIPATGEVNHVDLRTEIMDNKGSACECSMTPIAQTLLPQ